MRKLVSYALIIFQIGLVFSLIRGIQLAIKARTRVTDLEERKTQLAGEQAKLQDELAYVQSDYYVEKVAREELQLGKPGETVVIVPEGAILVENGLETADKEEEKPNYLKWWEVLAGQD